MDFIRAFATISIIFTHYNALFIFDIYKPQLVIISTHIFNVYIGDFGVSLFLIISGASLMKAYEKKIENFSIKEFYIKRIKRIYPMFWIAYIMTMCIGIIQYGDGFINRGGVPKVNFIYTILGVDGYLSLFGVKTLYIIGECFLGFIIIFYVIFPFILKIIKKYPKVLFTFAMLLYFVSIYLLRNAPCRSYILPTKILEIFFGIYFVYYKLNVKWYAFIPCVLVLISNHFFNIPINYTLKTAVIGISSFLVLVYISHYFEKKYVVKNICSIICKYSYPCFIMHHWVINEVTKNVNLGALSKSSSFIIFISCIVMIIIASYILQKITDKVLEIIKNIKTKTAV